ncbi:PepSY domain-containing protein (plasmid) [Ensifer adhaerens]|uniref:PepSY domain-containing protein n=1 Tax=Ensifer adhaerens TaxID=106592 RepID=UPI001CBBD911|nr:PepSY domain-containing protein [Ensifer adhaerens]MBZ7927691.1 PepSY domain-containing protein [Ensifer adhaerens]UAX98086.1 PepSY domain-containing protein [Ensifer adhaerens]UAY05467.1 PepSY domain-containing protein [Ensifer adhaerens]UAY12845.1 PepSY domain-containing protein [Ensifer adhaerens]
MKNISIFAAALMCVVATTTYAQTTPSPNGDTPAVATPDTKNPTAPVEGANSFTETQAKERIEAAGYTDVTGLKLDDKGVWQATAKKGGKSVAVALDYQGNVTAK